MHNRTKATNISKKVKAAVYARDEEHCLMCGIWVPESCACCHFISRAQLGLGIEENILTLCPKCHRIYDGPGHRENEDKIRTYLKSRYPDWDEKKLIYSKWSALAV